MTGKLGRKDDDPGRCTARRFGLPEKDLEAPDPKADLVHRVEVDHHVRFPRAPLKSPTVGPPPRWGREEVQPYSLERDAAPALGDVALETDVALDLEEGLHRDAQKKNDSRGAAKRHGDRGQEAGT